MTKQATQESRVTVHVPRGQIGDDPNLFVSVGGINYLLPRGESSKVPTAVAEEIARAERARERMERRAREMASR